MAQREGPDHFAGKRDLAVGDFLVVFIDRASRDLAGREEAVLHALLRTRCHFDVLEVDQNHSSP